MNTPCDSPPPQEVAAAPGYSVFYFLLDKYSLAAWQRFLIAARKARPTTARRWRRATASPPPRSTNRQDYLPEYFGGSFPNQLLRPDGMAPWPSPDSGLLGGARTRSRRWPSWCPAPVAAKETELRDLARQVSAGLEGEQLLLQGQAQMKGFHTPSRARAKQRYEAIGGPAAARRSHHGDTPRPSPALLPSHSSRRASGSLAELKCSEARAAASEAIKVFAELSDEEHYRQSSFIIQELKLEI